PALEILPTMLTTNTLRTAQFTANLRVTWSIDEGDAGGFIDGQGQYVPPLQAGTYHVTATAGDARVSALVTVTPLTLDLVAGGLGGLGTADGVGDTARFNKIHALAVDQQSLYVADSWYPQTNDYLEPLQGFIRKVDLSTHHVSTLAGGAPKWVDG